MEFYHEKALYTMLFLHEKALYVMRFLHEKAYTDASSQKRTVIILYMIGLEDKFYNGDIIELRNVVWREV